MNNKTNSNFNSTLNYQNEFNTVGGARGSSVDFSQESFIGDKRKSKKRKIRQVRGFTYDLPKDF